MLISPASIPDVLLVEPDVWRDARGFFMESYHARKYAEAGLKVDFVQDNHSRSEEGTLRGLHAQLRRQKAWSIWIWPCPASDDVDAINAGSKFLDSSWR